MIVSAVLSIHNRSVLFRRALLGYLWQTMPKDDWEIVLVDDMSTEDLTETYQGLIGHINIKHVKMDHTRHPIWKARNPKGKEEAFENWYHTPAVSTNIGFSLAQGQVICLCHPEIIHAPDNFKKAAEVLKKDKIFLFGKTMLGTQAMNKWLGNNPTWSSFGWYGLLGKLYGIENKLDSFRDNELYWYTSFLRREAAEKIGGVDFDYLNGVAGEDDDFKERMMFAGYPPKLIQEVQGFHQDHSDEKEKHRQRESQFWKDGLAHNRQILRMRKELGFPKVANRGFDWTGKECIVDIREYYIGKRKVRKRTPT